MGFLGSSFFISALDRLKSIFKRPVEVVDVEYFKAAGCVFTNGAHILAGYQPRKKKPCITGIGGSRIKGEIFMDTAIRETLEELFEFETIPPKLIAEVQDFQPMNVIQVSNYVMVIYSFETLESIMRLASTYPVKSRVYYTMPLTLLDLLLKRIPSGNEEITHMTLLPLVEGLKIQSEFVNDIQEVIHAIRRVKQ
jgi:hypothetical protein